VTELLAQPLSADDAVQIALFNNKGLQADFFELGIAEANLVQAGRLANPAFAFGRRTHAGEVEWERALSYNLARLLTMPMVIEMESRHFARRQRQATLAMLALASDTRKAYYRAVAADQGVHYMRQVQEAAEASAELARRMREVGNWNALNQARQQSFHADASLNLALAYRVQSAARERLTRLMGLWGEQIPFKLPERLPDLPNDIAAEPDIERIAMRQRLDLQAARLEAEQTASNLGLTKATRFINVLDVAGINNRFSDGSVERGWEVVIELPIFDWGESRVNKAESIYMQALARTAQAAVNARSEVREAYANWVSGYEVARHYRDQIVPLKKRISEENLLRYNGMLIGVFELLADTRAQIGSVNAAIEAQRDYWLARADLDMALLGKPMLTVERASAVASAEPPGVGH
jgi:outer membrane protein TolC